MLIALSFLLQATPHVSGTPYVDPPPSGFWSIEGVLFIVIAVILIPALLGWAYVRRNKKFKGMGGA